MGPVPAPVQAASSIGALREQIDEANTTLRRLEQEQADAERRLRALKQDETAIAERVRILEEQIRATRVRLAELTEQVREAEARVEAKQREIDEATRRLEQREDYVARRLRAIQENGTVGVVEVLFEANSFADFLTRLDLLSRILRHDVEVMAEVKAERERLVAEKRQLEAERRRLAALKAEVERQHQRLNATVASHRAELAKLAEQRRQIQRHLAALEADSRAVERMLKNLQADLKRRLEALQRNRSRGPRQGGGGPVAGSGGGGGGGGGRFAWPVPGEYYISSGFGYRNHPIYGSVRMHTGVDIDAEGPPDPDPSTWDKVVAAEDGIVVTAGYMSGYGNAIVIAHDERLSTLYGHLSEIYVGPGTTVRRGQVIGMVGTTGASTGTHLHFEVRVNGQPVDPMPYLR
ncbi:murein hydrolase activator EnvC family protein [Thermaerobacter composti]|uniref:Peptidoglycan DD-metalloendopeptidase family protein n=1 Tax=Thermaerobacter composti TaxID=554949 RepID=A0ABZ0QP49_9FIRM|nr:peptidoglycan DD-metalloendopeptidase family protein [Thermaerobacter composti]WPD19256.1 peptidoglycan DD-metalloendopeptidase family protein [Thermaerobacter composti]